MRRLASSLFLLALFVGSGMCQEVPQVTELPPVLVLGDLAVDATGTSRLDRDLLEQLPTANGTVGELLQFFPDVQFSEDFGSSRRGGEILPPDVSISGGKVYQNNFSLDGFSNNSLLDPTARNPMLLTDVPGHPQRFFIDSSLAEEINLYDSNIPARFGHFTGGVVDVKTRRPGDRFGGDISYRHTRDSWTSLQLSDDDRAGISASTSDDRQPEFRKHQGGAGFRIPLGDGLGLLTDYRFLSSTIPLQHLGEEKAQHRRNQNLFGKFLHEAGEDDQFELTALYAPYTADYFIRDTANSRFDVVGGGWMVGGAWRHFWLDRELNMRLSGGDHWNERESPRDWKNWAATDSKPWGRVVGSESSQEGGFGDLEKSQQSIEFAADLQLFPEFATGAVGQEITVGTEMSLQHGSFRRPESSAVYTQPVLTPDVICGADGTTCVDGEQYFSKRWLYRAQEVDTSILSAALHLEDRLTWRRLMVRPGLRIDYDDYLQNLNVGPRIATEYDLRGDRSSRLVAGANRYFGQGLLTFKLREVKKRPLVEYRTTFGNLLQAWQENPSQPYNESRFSDLRTPYTDELVFGFDQRLLSGDLSAKWVGRWGHDEFARSYGAVEEDGLRYYSMNNRGSSRHSSFRVSWERAWQKHYLLLSWNYQESSTSHENYDAVLDNEASEERVWYQGEILYRSELPRRDYNRPYTLELLYRGSLPWGVTWTNFVRYLGPYRALENTYEERPLPGAEQRIDLLTGLPIEESLDVYDDVRHGSELIVDWKIAWEGRVAGENRLRLELDLLNLLNRRIESATTPGSYRLGRQLWLGFSLDF